MATRTERRRAAVDRRREFARRSVMAQVAARRRRSRIRWSAAAAGVAVLGAGAIVLIASRDDGGIPDLALSGKGVEADGALGITAPLSSYRIDYEVTNYSADPTNPTRSTETIRTSRPFGSEVTITDDSGVQSYTTVLGKGQSVVPGATAGETTTTVDVIPAAAGIYDWRLDATLDDLVASGNFTMEERREVIGRECQVYRTGSAPEFGTVTAATDTDYAQLCIDASGLILEQIVYVSGSPYQHLEATAVSEEPVEDIAVEGEPADTSTSFTDIGTDAAPAEGYWSLSTVPEGYELVGRYAYVVPGEAPAEATTDTTVPVDTTAAPTATTAATDSAVTDSTVPDSGAADTTVAESPAPTSAAQGFAGSSVLSALTSTTTAAPTTTAPTTTAAPAEETTTVPAESTTTTTAAPAAPPVTTYFDVYRNGDDFIVVQQGPSAQAPVPSGATSQATIDALGTVTTSSDYVGSMILAHPAAPADWFVSITGSVDMATLTTIAGTLAQPAS